jgi:hypothetical protein
MSTHEVIGRAMRPNEIPTDINTTTLETFKIGESAELRHLRVGAADFKHVNEDRASFKLPELQGDLGSECLQMWAALIDFDAAAIYLRTGATVAK